MSIPIKTIEEVKLKNTTNRAYLFIDASDNILKMKINDKFYSFNLTNEPSITGKPDLIASGFSESQFSFNSLIPTNNFNGTWTYTQQDNGEDVWVHESGNYQLRLSSTGTYGYPLWHVYLTGDNPGPGEIWEMDPDHGSSYSSPTEVKQWSSQLANLTGKFEEKTSSENGSSSGSSSGSTIDVAQSVLGVVFEVGATSSVAHNDIMGLFVNENETDYVCVDNSDIKIIYYPPECEDEYEDANGMGSVTLSNRYVLKNATTGEIYAISNPSNNILNFYTGEIAPGCSYGAVDAKPIYKNYEIKWDGNSNNIAVGKYTYIEEEKKWIKINENGELDSSLYLKLYNYLSSYTTYAFIVVYHNDDPMYASFSNPDFPGYLLDDEGNLIAEYSQIDCTNKNGIKMTGLGWGYTDDGGEGLFTYSGKFGINVESFSGDLDTVDCPTLWFEDVNVTHKKSE